MFNFKYSHSNWLITQFGKLIPVGQKKREERKKKRNVQNLLLLLVPTNQKKFHTTKTEKNLNWKEIFFFFNLFSFNPKLQI